VKNTRNFTLMVCINFFMRMIDFDFDFVEYTFGAHEEVSGGRICAPDNSRSTINFHAESTIGKEPIQHGQVTRKDAIFGVLKVKIFGHLVVFS
jgi:hypothetical protein